MYVNVSGSSLKLKIKLNEDTDTYTDQKYKHLMKQRKPPTATLPIVATVTTSASVSPVTSSTKILMALTLSRFKDLLLILSFLLFIYLYYHARPQIDSRAAVTGSFFPTTRHHLLFAIASSSSSFSRRQSYFRLWYKPSITRAFIFLDSHDNSSKKVDPTLPPVIISEDTSLFPYSFKGGSRAAVRLARVVQEAVNLSGDAGNVRWFVFGDDDTVFVVENLVKTLSKYDHNEWFYVGANSEGYEQNAKNSFNMAFGGGGFAISYSLGKVLRRVLDSCLMRYGHLYGSDARIFSCLAELGVGLTHEPGFHQVDVRGNLFGLLSAHPLSPLISLHHLDAVNPLFPNMTKMQALQHLFEAINVDPTRILQQTVCYDRTNSLTVSVAWGYSIQVFEGNELLPDLLSLQKTFSSWKRGAKVEPFYMFNVREYPRSPCKRPLVFFMENVAADKNGVWSEYIRHDIDDCRRPNATAHLKRIRVFSQKLEPVTEQLRALRRQCCDISTSASKSMVINIRGCGSVELIAMHT